MERKNFTLLQYARTYQKVVPTAWDICPTAWDKCPRPWERSGKVGLAVSERRFGGVGTGPVPSPTPDCYIFAVLGNLGTLGTPCLLVLYH